MRVEDTLGNKDWLNQNEGALRGLFPETWTHTSNLNNLGIMYHLKLMGVDWPSTDFTELFNFFLATGVILQQDHQFKRGKNHIEFEKVFKMKDAEPEKKEKKAKEDKAEPNPMTPPVILAFVFWYICGWVIAQGFWSTAACLFPPWALYLVAERLLTMWGII